MLTTRRTVLGQFVLGGLGASLLPATVLSAQEIFPSRQITIVVPFSAGGTADVLARAIATRLRMKYGTPVVVENRPGAGGNIGAEAVAKAKPDGYTLVLGTVGIHAAYTVYSKIGYDPARDLRPVSLLGEVPCVIAVHPSRPFNTFAEFVGYAKSHPDTLTFGSAGNGSSTHMVGELFQQATGIKLRHIPYRGSSMAMNDLIGGQIDMMFELVTTAAEIVESGRIRALAVTSKQRSASLPKVATVSELAVPDFDGTGWFTIATAATVPDLIVTQLNRDIEQILRGPELQDMWRALALTIIGGSTDEATRFFTSERTKWGQLIKAANIHVD